MEISTIGVSKEAQLRAVKILEVVSNSCFDFTLKNFFEYSQSLMTDIWQRLTQVVMDNDLLVLQNYSPQYCLFTKDLCESHPGYHSNQPDANQHKSRGKLEQNLDSISPEALTRKNRA
ncbi:hypothetical protein KY285_024005 [Solanum tuberosum]|nr:hypothetical protein KY289_024363 [Solanum tuberosum]KAH0676204.1 hypothetical protein KY285_024005 [Solanum tuberosum]